MSSRQGAEVHRESVPGSTSVSCFLKREGKVARRVRLSFDLMVPEESGMSMKQWKRFVQEVEDYARVVIAPAANIPFDKSGEPHYTVHEHNSTRRISCPGCIELSDDGHNHQN